MSNFWNFFGAIQIISCWARLVTMEETWLYHYDPETNQQPKEWGHRGSTRPKKFRVQKSAGKVLASIFWDQLGILLIAYLPKGQTTNVELVQLKDILKEKRRENLTKGVLFLHVNAPDHRVLATQKKLAYLGFQFSGSDPVGLPPVLWTEKQLKGRHFSSDAEVIAAAETWLDGQPSEKLFEWLAKVRAKG
jgi:hypothetical protein